MSNDMPERIWTLSDDSETVRMQLPPLPIAGMPQQLCARLRSR